jgi:hypothetical protein
MSAEMPIWIKSAKFPVNQSRILQALELGASGIWLNESIFSQDDVLNSLHSVMQIVHPELIIQVQG